ncbi:MAG: hypothetical protein R3B72_39295 [Polyangiaceae bacterium]
MNRQLASSFVVTVVASLGVASIGGGCGSTISYGGEGGEGGQTSTPIPEECPEALPGQGAACSDPGLFCQYDEICPGAFQAARCDGGRWVVETPPPCNPPACPEQRPANLSSCPEEGLTCSYPDLECGSVFYGCLGGLWEEESGCPPVAPCPNELPVNGAECDYYPGAEPPYAVGCSYDVETPSCGASTATADCVFSSLAGLELWEVSFESLCSVPPSECQSHTHESFCDADPNCRWLAEPYCSEGLNPSVVAGCYPAAPCTTGSCGPGATCTIVDYDPCYQQYCDACTGETPICLPTN